MPRVERVDFDEPVLVQLAKYRCRQRVLGVRYEQNPNGLFPRKRFAYATAEWQLPGTERWLVVRDLVDQMRLANCVQHPFPHNPEKYANEW